MIALFIDKISVLLSAFLFDIVVGGKMMSLNDKLNVFFSSWNIYLFELNFDLIFEVVIL